MPIRIGRIGIPQRRVPATHNPGSVTAGSQGTAVPSRSTGAFITTPRAGGLIGARPTIPLSVHAVSNNQSPHGAVQQQHFPQPLKPQRFK
jgi:hypothetical protein